VTETVLYKLGVQICVYLSDRHSCVPRSLFGVSFKHSGVYVGLYRGYRSAGWTDARLKSMNSLSEPLLDVY
jgi:hypothetical protein